MPSCAKIQAGFGWEMTCNIAARSLPNVLLFLYQQGIVKQEVF